MSEITHEKATFLPRPEITREQCVEGCEGCGKMYSDNGTNIGEVCVAYVSPKAQFRRGVCLLKTNRTFEEEGGKKINPLKASKRARK